MLHFYSVLFKSRRFQLPFFIGFGLCIAYAVVVSKKMILSYRKRATSPDCQVIRNPSANSSITTATTATAANNGRHEVESKPIKSSQSQVLQTQTQSASSGNAEVGGGSPTKNRKNKPFASFFQNLFVPNNSSQVPGSSDTAAAASQVITSGDPINNSKNGDPPKQPDSRRDSSYHNEAYAFSSPSSCSTSAESINTVLSTNSFSFVHPKKYGGKKRHGKRIPLDQDPDVVKPEPTPVKLKVQHAQPLPNSRRKKLSTLSRLGMKIGLKSKYNLQSCESLQHVSGSLKRDKSAAAGGAAGGTGAGDNGSSKSNKSQSSSSSKRRAPLPPSSGHGPHGHGHTHAHAPCSSKSFHIPPGPSSTSVLAGVKRYESVQLKSVTNISSFDRRPPTPPTKKEDANTAQSNSNLKQSQCNTTPADTPLTASQNLPRSTRWGSSVSTQPLQHQYRWQYQSDAYNRGGSTARIYHHVRGKRRAPVPPVRLIMVTKISGDSSSTSAIAQSKNLQWIHPKPHPEGIPSPSSASQDERIIQDILEVKPAAAAATSEHKSGTGNGSCASASASTAPRTGDVSTSASRFSTQNSTNTVPIPNTANNKSGPPNPTQQQQQMKNFAHVAAATHQESQKHGLAITRNSNKSPITATLGCYESFEEDDDFDDDNDDGDHLSTNSLLVHEKRLNEQVKSHLCNNKTKAGAPAPAATPSSTSRMSFSFFKKNSDKDHHGRNQYANAANGLVQQASSQEKSNDVHKNQDAGTNPTVNTSYDSGEIGLGQQSPANVKMTPRPWYKRSSKNKHGPTTTTNTGVSPTSTKPSISILTNISELDRQAAVIVEEKRRRSAIEQNESAKKLILMFNTTFSNSSKEECGTNKNGEQGSTTADADVSLPSAITAATAAGIAGQSMQSSSGIDERKKLAIVQPQTNHNYNKVRPISTPDTRSSSAVGNSSSRPGIRGVSLGHDYNAAAAITMTGANNASVNTSSAAGNMNDWSCPRCTLQNAHWRSFCDACHFRQGSNVVQSIASIFETNTTQPQQVERRNSNSGDHRDNSGSGVSISESRTTATSSSTGTNTITTVGGSQSVAPNSTNTNTNGQLTSSTTPIAQAQRTSTQTNSSTAQVSSSAKSAMNLPHENLLCHTKEKSDKDKKLDGIKLHAEDPDIEELDLEKLREARLAFFTRHKVASPPTSPQPGKVDHQTRWGKQAVRVTSDVGESVVKVNPSTSKPVQEKMCPTSWRNKSANGNNLNVNAHVTPNAERRKHENDGSASADEDEEETDFDTSSPQLPQRWKSFNPPEKHQSLTRTTNQHHQNYGFYDLDPTYENWHLKLSELDDINGDDDDDDDAFHSTSAHNSNSAFIRNINTEIKDQLTYFDRLKSELRQQRSAAAGSGDGLDEYSSDFSNSESDASTVIDATNFGVGMEHRRLRQLRQERRDDRDFRDPGHGHGGHGPQLYLGAESARRRISVGDPTPAPSARGRPFLYHEQVRHRYSHDNGATSSGTAPSSTRPYSGSFERYDDTRHDYNEGTPRSQSQQPDLSRHRDHRSRNHASGSEESERRQQNRALEHSASAISKQLRKLEWAINVGDHKLAASLAHDLAILKATCNKVSSSGEQSLPQQTQQPQPITIRVYVEDRVMHQGPFQVPVTTSTTVRELKEKIEKDWGIPVLFQKWILGRKIAEDETQPLVAYEVVHDSMAFLYLVTPNNGKQLENNNNGVSSGNEDSIQIMSHLAKSPPISRKIGPNVGAEFNPIKEENDKVNNDKPAVSAVAGTNSNMACKPPMEKDKTEKSNFSPPMKREPITSKSAQDPPTSRPIAQPIEVKHVKPEVATVPKLAQDQNHLVTIVGERKENNIVNAPTHSHAVKVDGTAIITNNIGIPKSNKTVTSKYIESIKQTTNSEPLFSPENSILKQNIHVEKVNAVAKKGTCTSAESKANTSTSIHSGISGTGYEDTVKVQHPLSPVAKPRLNISQQNGVPSGAQGPSITNAPPIPAKPAANGVNIERLLETNAEISNKTNNGTRKQSKVTRPVQEVMVSKKETESLSVNLMTKPVDKVTNFVHVQSNIRKEPSEPVKSQGPHENQSQFMNLSKKTDIKIDVAVSTSPSKVKPATVAASAGYQNKAPATSTASVQSQSPKSPPIPFPNKRTTADVMLPDQNIPEFAQIRSALNQLPPVGKSSTSSNSASASVQPRNLDTEVKPRSRWGASVNSEQHQQSQPQPQASVSSSSSSSNNTDHERILVTRKNSDAIDINLHIDEHLSPFPLPKNGAPVPSSSTSLAGATAQSTSKTKTLEKKEDNNETYRKMLQLMENEDCVRTTEEVDCPICFNKVGVGEGVTLRDCLHSFCRECLAGTIQYSDEPQVKCPYRDDKYSCESFLQDREIKGLVSPLMFEKHLAQAVKLAENKIANTFHCKTNDCTGWCIFEDDVNVFKCPVCRKSNCLTCQAIHEGKNCQEYQRELAIHAETDEGAKSSRIMLEKMIQRGEALECPACHVVLLKKWGCDWVRCSYCKTEICWVTKSFRWGKNGKGDTSGGCRCGVNGVKCHPKCTYCH